MRRVAAAALAHTVFFVCFTLGMGLISAVAPLAAQAFGARNPRLVRRSLGVGLWAALISLPLTAFPALGRGYSCPLGQPPAPAALAGQYLFGLAWWHDRRGGVSWPAQVHGRGKPAGAGLVDTLAAIPANGVLAYS